MTLPTKKFVVCALYKFTALDHYQSFQLPIREKLLEQNIVGTLLLADEGINGTIAGERQNMEKFLGWLDQQTGLKDIEVKQSETDQAPFKRTKVKLKKEIVTLGVDGIDPKKSAGTYVDPKDWNALIDDPDVILVDTRNEYEVEVGQWRKTHRKCH